MDKPFKKFFLTEFLWLMGLVLIAAIVEYVIIVVFDLHPILSVKIQGLIGLTIIAYGIRMVARMTGGEEESPEESKQ
ncbi:hypothetical protein LQ318_16395 [Aliifodinibius salicampi]|uniref:Uncharacterized protein n=1 Tax=Fodinibius salicampi TaxID=1920655 RepID=A0ABT3Q316_9BACT|nr:hypothetical protein [Fodinibius salicampi]MCW9714487.1 hypothetical protein [Fodinibius salicampi]